MNTQVMYKGTENIPFKRLHDAGVGLENIHNPSVICGHGMGNRSPCPLCHSHTYMVKRIKKAVKNGYARMDMKIKSTNDNTNENVTDEDYLRCLEVKDWREACSHIVQKMDNWNFRHQFFPQRQMTILNMQTDHIRPVTLFKVNKDGQPKKWVKGSVSVHCCNHHTNLQPLLQIDNAWKGDTWGVKDEQFWLEHIILQSDYKDVYYSGKIQPSLMEALK